MSPWLRAERAPDGAIAGTVVGEDVQVELADPDLARDGLVGASQGVNVFGGEPRVLVAIVDLLATAGARHLWPARQRRLYGSRLRERAAPLAYVASSL